MRHHPILVHGDAVPRILAELEKGNGGGAVHFKVVGGQVGHQWGHGSCLAEGGSVPFKKRKQKLFSKTVRNN